MVTQYTHPLINKEDPSITALEKKNADLSRLAAAMGMVLVENTSVLPIRPQAIALFGNGARRTVKSGKGSGDINNRHTVTVEEGLEKSGFTICTKAWLDRCDEAFSKDEAAWHQEIDLLAQQQGIPRTLIYLQTVHRWCCPPPIKNDDIPENVDTAIYVIARHNGEGTDRVAQEGDFYLWEEERRHIELLASKMKRLIVVLNTGSVIATDFFQKEMAGRGALLLMGQPGQQAGDALSDIITGRVTPCGKLTATWANRYEDYGLEPSFIAQDGCRRSNYSEGVFVGYRGFDHRNQHAAYPFGYGLSYAEFTFSDLAISEQDDALHIAVTVKNCSEQYSEHQIVQIYAELPHSEIPRPPKMLTAFCKTELLQPMQSQQLSLSFQKEQLCMYSSQLEAFVLPAGEYRICVGQDSQTLRYIGSFIQTEERLYQRRPCFWKPGEQGPQEDCPPDTSWKKYAETAQTRALSDEQLIALVLGDYKKNENSVLGTAIGAIPGAAGYTTDRIPGVSPFAMADGPCGLRLFSKFETDASGKIINMSDMDGLEDGKYSQPLKQVLPAAHRYYQYCTAFPIGTTLAQSWDLHLLEEVGKAVAEEMRTFGISLWLAPGMNLQRDPLCGRNFEYYSEDPLLTGRVAAAIVRGVQFQKGTGAVIKHFACNNQELNRLFGDSRVDAQTMYELYLKSFEIAIRESSPAGIMTAYNAVNGVKAANSSILCLEILRKQWNYQGLIMTDWGTTDFGSDPIACITSGNDLIMPGSKKDEDALRSALLQGTLSRQQLARCAQHVIDLQNTLFGK